MTRRRMALLLAFVAAGGYAFHAQTPPPQAAYRFQQIAPGIYSALGTGAMNVGSNSAVHGQNPGPNTPVNPGSGVQITCY